MFRILMIGLCFFAAQTVLAEEPADASERINQELITASPLKLSVTTHEYSVDQPIRVRVELLNRNDAPYFVTSSHGLDTIDFSIKDQDGRAIAKTRYGKSREEIPAVGSGIDIDLIEPGSKGDYTFLLNRRFDMTMAEEYTIIATAKVAHPDADDQGKIHSNPIKISLSVTEPDHVHTTIPIASDKANSNE